MNFEEYAEIEALNWSTLKAMKISPKHFRHAQTSGYPETASQRLGRAAHCAILEPLRFETDYVVYHGTMNRKHKAFQEFIAEHEGKEIIKPAEYQSAILMRDAIRRNPDAFTLLSDGEGETEVTCEWEDQITGLQCKARIDHLLSWCVTDLKTAADIRPHKFTKQSANYGYHTQLAWYCDAVFNTRGWTPGATIIAVESSPPHDVVVYDVPTDIISVGRDEYRKLLHRVRECREANHWPGVSGDEHTIELYLPAWMQAEEEDVELAIGGESFAM